MFIMPGWNDYLYTAFFGYWILKYDWKFFLQFFIKTWYLFLSTYISVEQLRLYLMI